MAGIKIEAIPAYNMVHERSPGRPFHPKGAGNGYVLTFADKRLYIAGDAENIPEMTADAAKMFMPEILYPYHFGDTDTSAIVGLLKGSGIEVRIRGLR